MKHQIFLNPKGFIEIDYIDQITEDDNRVIIPKSFDMTDSLISQGKKARILIDFTKVKFIDPKVTDIAIKAIHDGNFDRLAIFGLDQSQPKKESDIVTGSREVKPKIHEFKSRTEAETWLLE